ncbi:farnesol dehydrogenase-like [Topomyia yanbarensis]|uniref:farnesol dehydrogenase-like n=1 Tax=Topomyia yanbarensis TaxID=2498891 RepID=UPI00273B3D48|nr:farnesol dehydrogenase-like [Topomyia yanbarensis]
MERWQGKVAIVTGASSGIGAATAKALTVAGMVTIGLARRVDRVEALKSELPVEVASRMHSFRCDVSKEADILAAFEFVEDNFGGVDVLVNNAGTYQKVDLLAPGNTDCLRQSLNTNVLGLALCSREAFQSMKKRSVDGHIFHINSIEGHKVPFYPGANLYPASKYAVTAITETMRNELREAGTKIKVTSISPGFVRTEMVELCDTYNNLEVESLPMLQPEDIAKAIVYALGTPPHVQIHELTIKPVGEPV